MEYLFWLVVVSIISYAFGNGAGQDTGYKNGYRNGHEDGELNNVYDDSI